MTAPTPLPSLPPGAVVVGVDGSPASVQALRWGAEHATASGRPLYAVLVRDWARDPRDDAAWLAAGQALLRTAVLDALGCGDLPVTDVILRGHAARELVAVSSDAGILVLGNRGSDGLPGGFLGTVATSAAAHARCPVVVVHPDVVPIDDPVDVRAGAPVDVRAGVPVGVRP